MNNLPIPESLTLQLTIIENIFTIFQDVCDATAKGIREQYFDMNSHQIEAHLASFQEENRLLRIGIIGRVKAGKSSLINSLLFDGRDVLPKSATPMTAALTSVRYAEKFTASVDFYTEEDIFHLKKQYTEFQEALDARVTEEKALELERLEKAQSNPNAKSPPIPKSEEVLKKSALKAVESERPELKAAHDVYEKIQQASVNILDVQGNRTLTANSEDELNRELNQYVGANGKFMPYTRSVNIGMPLESLKDIEVIDTPGLNDAVKSREARTIDILKSCNVVFIVSPAGQFLNAQDMSLANRLSQREGIQEIYVVASRSDQQLYGDVLDKSAGNLDMAISLIQDDLSESAKNALSQQKNPVLTTIAETIKNRLFITAGICQTFLLQPRNLWNNEVEHAYGLLEENYPEFFNGENSGNSLNKLSGTKALLETIAVVHNMKEEIFLQHRNNYLSTRIKLSQEGIQALLHHFNQLYSSIQSVEVETIQAQLVSLKRVREKGIKIAQNCLADQVDELHATVSNKLKLLINNTRKEVQGDINASEGETIETYMADKDGFWAGVASFFGGGKEERTRTLTIVDTSSVRQALEILRTTIQRDLQEASQPILAQWRKNLAHKLSEVLRTSMNEHQINREQLVSVCNQTIRSVRDLQPIEVTDLPNSLKTSGRLTGSSAKSYVQDTIDYVSSIITQAETIRTSVLSQIRKLENYNLGDTLFDYLEDNINALQSMLASKSISLDKIEQIQKLLKGVA